MKGIIISIFLAASVNVSAQPDVEDTSSNLVISAIGKPMGEKTEMKIGKDGGSFISSNGKVTLVIAAGSVTKNTKFSIVPISNAMPNGNELAYRLEPSGIQFQKPVQLIFHYDDEEVKDSAQLLMGIAMQNDKGQWFGLKKFILDTIAKTISGNINHFSDWSKFDAIKINPSYARVQVKNTKTLEVIGVVPAAEENSNEEVTALTRSPKKVIWMVNNITGGNKINGTINGRMLGGYYTAPEMVPEQNPVSVTANLKGLHLKFNGINFNDLRLVSNILIYDNAYEVLMVSSTYEVPGTAYLAVNYKDTGSFVISITGKEAKLIEKVNKNLPADLDYKGKCKVEKVLPGSGNIHIAGIQSIKLIPPTTSKANPWVEIIFMKTPTIIPLIKFTCPPVGNSKQDFVSTNQQARAMTASILPAFPQQVKFEAKEGEQTILLIGTEGGEMFVKFTVSKLKD